MLGQFYTNVFACSEITETKNEGFSTLSQNSEAQLKHSGFHMLYNRQNNLTINKLH